MRLMKVPLMCLLIVMAFAGLSQAGFIDCDGVDPSPFDSVAALSCSSKPADTVLVPIFMSNDSAISGFSYYLEFDSSQIKPIWIGSDTLWGPGGVIISVQQYYEHKVNSAVFDTAIYFNNQWFYMGLNLVDETDLPEPSSPGLQRITFQALPPWIAGDSSASIVPAIQPGPDTIMFIPFITSPTAVHESFSYITFYDGYLWVVDTTVVPPDTLANSCLYSRYSGMSGNWERRMKVVGGIHTVDTNTVVAGPTINYFYANPTAISNPGDPSTLSWSTSSATSVTISPDVGTVAGSGSAIVNPTATTTYTLTATNAQGQNQAQATVTVGGSSNNNPVVTLSPDIPAVTIAQGETINYTVIATDVDGDQVTLTPSSLPPNATFNPNPAVGMGSTSAAFSFTPNTTQSGTFAFVFTANDGIGGIGTKALTIVVEELEHDRLFTVSAPGQAPVGGLSGTPSIYFPINLITSQTVYGIQFDFMYDAEYFTVDSFVTTDRTADYVVYDDIGATPGTIRVVTFGMANEPILPGTSSEILYVVMSIDPSATPGDYPVYIEDGWESINPDPDYPSLPLVVDSGVIQVDLPGDVNLDKRVDVADLVNVVGYIIGDYTFTARQFAVADVTTNLAVDVFDLVGIINLIYGLPLSPSPMSPAQFAIVELDYGSLNDGASDVMVVRSELPVDIAGAQVEIRYDPATISLGTPDLAEDADGLNIRYRDDGAGRMLLLMYFKNPHATDQLVKAGFADLVNIPFTALNDVEAGDESQLRLSKAMLSTSNGAPVKVEGMDPHDAMPNSFVLHQNYPNPFNPTTTIEFDLRESADYELTIYNILGQAVDVFEGRGEEGLNGISWDAERRGSGVYLYRLEVGDRSESKKMLLLK